MNLKWITAFIACSTLFAAESDRLGLEQAKKYAVQHNLEVLALEKAVESSEATVTRARSSFYPRLTAVAGADTYSQNTFKSTAPIAMLEAEINLFNGFGDEARLDMASLEAERTRIKLERLKFRVGLDVEQQFHLFLYKSGAIALKEEALKVNEKQQAMARQRRAGGMGSVSDILEFDLRESLLRSDLQALGQELEEARTNLKRLLGDEIGSRIEPTGHLMHQHVTAKLQDVVERIRTESETVLLAEKTLAIARRAATQWRARWFPKVDVLGRVGYMPYDLRQDPTGPGAAVGIQLRFDLFNGFDSLGERREQIAQRERAEADLKYAIVGAVSQIEIAYRKMVTVQNRVDLESKNFERARRYYDSVFNEYRRGVKNSVDLKVAAETLFETKLRRDTFKYEFLLQRIELERALGGPVPTENIPEGT